MILATLMAMQLATTLTCEIRATLIAGDWDDEHYSRGYREGYASGSYDCKNK